MGALVEIADQAALHGDADQQHHRDRDQDRDGDRIVQQGCAEVAEPSLHGHGQPGVGTEEGVPAHDDGLAARAPVEQERGVRSLTELGREDLELESQGGQGIRSV